jgi:hypothetical protein
VQVIRNAIEMYAANNGSALPGADGTEATFKANLVPHLRGTFPTCPVGAKNASVDFGTTDPLTGDASPTKGWRYNKTTGAFIANYSAVSTDGTTTYDKF